MKLFCVSVALLTITVVTVSGHKHHGHEAISYSVVTKHEDKHDHKHGHEHHSHHHDNDHLEHHASYVSHDHHAHKSHHEHKVEHHGNNDHDKHHHHHHGHYEHDGHHHDHYEHHDKHSHPKYEFKYGVKDSKTGDIKQQWEQRDGDKVKGSYSFKEADGTTRVVNYTSDKKKGFEATVHKIGHAHKGHVEHSSHY